MILPWRWWQQLLELSGMDDQVLEVSAITQIMAYFPVIRTSTIKDLV
jgi:hypothetical protein